MPLSEKLPYILPYYLLLLFSLSFHEAAHAWMANRFGDPTARLLGRISLNPIRHMDPIGTFLLPLISLFTGVPLIGWGKPVPVNFLHLRNPRKDDLWISAAGPLTNFTLACGFAGLTWALVLLVNKFGGGLVRGSSSAQIVSILYNLFATGVTLNLALAVFNMLPVFPLDGGGVIRGLLPDRLVYKFDAIAKYGIFILLLLFATRTLDVIFVPVEYLANWMLPV